MSVKERNGKHTRTTSTNNKGRMWWWRERKNRTPTHTHIYIEREREAMEEEAGGAQSRRYGSTTTRHVGCRRVQMARWIARISQPMQHSGQKLHKSSKEEKKKIKREREHEINWRRKRGSERGVRNKWKRCFVERGRVMWSSVRNHF